jgi:hypothetical protein
MIKAMLWKEWRRSRLLILLMAVLMVVFSFIISIFLAVHFANLARMDTIAVVSVGLWLFLALLLPVELFAVERESGTLDFLLASPVRWWQLWFIKIAYGFLALAGFALLILLNLFCFMPQAPDGTLSRLREIVSAFTTSPLLLLLPSLYFVSCTVTCFVRASLEAWIATIFVYLGAYIASFCVLEVIFHMPLVLILLALIAGFNVCLYRCHCLAALRRLRVYTALTLNGLWLYLVLCGAAIPWLLESDWIRFVESEVAWPGEQLAERVYLWGILVLIGMFIGSCLASFLAFAMTRREKSVREAAMASGNLLLLVTLAVAYVIYALLPAQYELHDACYSARKPYIQPVQETMNLYHGAMHMARRQMVFNARNSTLSQWTRGLRPGLVQFVDGSPDGRWLLYHYPVFRCGIAVSWGIWAEDLRTGKQYLLAPFRQAQFQIEWALNGKRLALLMRPAGINPSFPTTLLVFDMAQDAPVSLAVQDRAGTETICMVENTGELYLCQTSQEMIHLGTDLQPKRTLVTIRDKCREFASKLPPNSKVAVFRMMSQDGEAMIFLLTLRQGPYAGTNLQQLWQMSLKNEQTTQIYEGRYLRGHIEWHDISCWSLDHTLLAWQGASEDTDAPIAVKLTDLSSGETKILSNDLSFIGFSADATHMVCEQRASQPQERQIVVMQVSRSPLTVHTVAQKEMGMASRYRWSPDLNWLVFLPYLPQHRNDSNVTLWRLHMQNMEWTEVKAPCYPEIFMSIDDQGRVYLAGSATNHIYQIMPDSGQTVVLRPQSERQ